MGLVHVICDYASGDLAFAEVVSAIRHHIPGNYNIHLTSVGSFETISTGFAVAQLALQQESLRDPNTIIFANCAPRRDRKEARINNEGEGFLYALLDNQVPILVVNSGYSLSFVRDHITELWSVDAGNGGSQFRSRDNFPPIVGRLQKGDLSFRRERYDPYEVVPEAPNGIVGYVDSFGNLKTTYREGDLELANLKPGQRVAVSINGIKISVTVASGSFNVQDGDIAFSPGSSGHDRRYWEIFQRGGSAWQTFRKPRVGSEIIIS